MICPTQKTLGLPQIAMNQNKPHQIVTKMTTIWRISTKNLRNKKLLSKTT